LLDTMAQPAWVVELIGRIQTSGIAEVVLCILNDPPPRTKPFLSRVRDAGMRLMYIMYSYLDRWYFGGRTTAFEISDIGPLVADAETMRVRPEQTRFRDRFGAGAVSEIREFDLDVIIRLGFRILSGDILTAARKGVWSLHHGDNRVNRGMPPGFWEVMECWPTTGVTLQRLTEDLDGGIVLERSVSATVTQSVVLNLDNYYWKSAPLVIRAIERLHRLGPDAPLAGKGTDTSHPEFYSRRLYRVPGNLQMIRLLIRYLGRYGRTRLSNLLYRDQWTLLFVLKSLENSSPDMRKFQRIVPPRDRFWADPHLLEKNDRCYVFFEELIFEDGRGTIAFVEIDQSGPVSAPQVVLERPYHLSYPHLVEHDGELYMIPETAENHTVELYRCTAFPDKWEHEIDLIAGIDAVDATVIEHDGTWWIFATVIENPGVASTDELHLFYSDEFPSANWTAHPLNPVISDVRRARPAGRLFTKDGRLYRPSQDSSGRYGRAVNINLVTTLSRTDYAEEVVSRIEPEWAKDVRGVHTLSIGDRIMLSDAEIRRPRYWT